MTVLCNQNTGGYPEIVLPRDKRYPVHESNFVSSSTQIINDNTSEYPLNIDAYYDVYGVLMFDSIVYFLVQDSDGMPGFFPSELFSVLDSSIPPDWSISVYHTCNGSILLLGYHDFVSSYAMLLDLIDECANAIEAFLAYISFYEEWYK